MCSWVLAVLDVRVARTCLYVLANLNQEAATSTTDPLPTLQTQLLRTPSKQKDSDQDQQRFWSESQWCSCDELVTNLKPS